MKRESFPNAKLIYKLAWSFHKTTGYNLQELISEATLAFVEAKSFFVSDDEGGLSKDTTFAQLFIKRKLIDFLRQEFNSYKYVQPTDNIPEKEYYYDQFDFESEDNFISKIQNLTDDQRHVIEVALSLPIESLPPKKANGMVHQALRQEGWTYERIKWRMAELTKFFNKKDYH